MNHYTIDILKADISYVIEAIRMRGFAIADQVTDQVNSQVQARTKVEAPIPQEEWSLTSDEQGDMIAKFVNSPAIKAAKKRNTKAAPYGYKKDGTPKARPGRKTTKGNK